MANVILNRGKVRAGDKGQAKELSLARRMLDKPGHYRTGQRDDAKRLLASFGIEKKEKWGIFDD